MKTLKVFSKQNVTHKSTLRFSKSSTLPKVPRRWKLRVSVEVESMRILRTKMFTVPWWISKLLNCNPTVPETSTLYMMHRSPVEAGRSEVAEKSLDASVRKRWTLNSLNDGGKWKVIAPRPGKLIRRFLLAPSEPDLRLRFLSIPFSEELKTG